jgi:uncharacterized protein YneF (UPF0154 family)
MNHKLVAALELAQIAKKLNRIAMDMMHNEPPLTEAQIRHISTAWGSDENVAKWNGVNVETVRRLRRGPKPEGCK